MGGPRLEAFTLPDLAPMLALPATKLRSLATHLAGIGLTTASLASISSRLHPIHPALRPAVRRHLLGRETAPWSAAARLLMFGDTVSRREAESALGDSLSTLLEVGVIAESEQGLSSRLQLGVVSGFYLFSDLRVHGEDAVLPPGDGTIAMIQAAFPERPVGRLLDLGCGSGTAALLLAKRAERVIATDIYDRALDLTKINAAINGIDNVETRRGSLFEPVQGEVFDLLLSQPPFIPMPEGAATSTFLYGGSRGDELPLALLRMLPPHLAEKGRAILLIDWPQAGEAVAARVRKALGEGDLDLLVLEAPPTTADEHAVELAAAIHGDLGPAYEEEAKRIRDHLEKQSIPAIVPAFVLIERAGGRGGFTDSLRITGAGRAKVTSSRIDKLFAARAKGLDPKKLLSTRLRVPAGTTLIEEQTGPGADKPSSLHARFAAETLIGAAPLTQETLALVTMVHEEDTVLAALGRFGEAFGLSFEEAVAKQLPTIAQALRQGLLEIAG